MNQSALPRHTNRLAKLVNKPGGITETEAVDAATVNMNEIRDRTLDEINATIDQMQQIAAGLELAHDAGELKRLYALSNTVMGVAGAFGMTGLSAVAYSLCELIDRLQTSGTWSARSVRIHVDSMRLIGRAGIDEQESQQITSALRTLVDRVPTSAEARPAAPLSDATSPLGH